MGTNSNSNYKATNNIHKNNSSTTSSNKNNTSSGKKTPSSSNKNTTSSVNKNNTSNSYKNNTSSGKKTYNYSNANTSYSSKNGTSSSVKYTNNTSNKNTNYNSNYNKIKTNSYSKNNTYKTNQNITSIKTKVNPSNLNNSRPMYNTYYANNNNEIETFNVETGSIEKLKVNIEKIDIKRISASAQGALDEKFVNINTDIWNNAELNVTEREDGSFLIRNGDVPIGFTDSEGLKSILNPTEKKESVNQEKEKKQDTTQQKNENKETTNIEEEKIDKKEKTQNNDEKQTEDDKEKINKAFEEEGRITEIPESVNQAGYTVTCYESDGWHLGGSKKATPIGRSSNQKLVNNLWNEQGSNYKNDLATLNVNGVDRYMVAVSQEIGKVGDVLNVELKDGTKLPCVIADSKDRKDANYTQYGHRSGNGINVLEFEVNTQRYNSSGNPGGENWKLDWDSTSPVKTITNVGSVLDSPDKYSTKNNI